MGLIVRILLWQLWWIVSVGLMFGCGCLQTLSNSETMEAFSVMGVLIGFGSLLLFFIELSRHKPKEADPKPIPCPVCGTEMRSSSSIRRCRKCHWPEQK